MAAYLIRRFLLMLLTLFGISVLIFVLLRIVPGNIADILFAAAGFINRPTRRRSRRISASISRSSFNTPSGSAACRGDLGYSYMSEKPTLQEIPPRMPISAKLAGMALLFAILFGIPLGVISAVRQNTPLDYVLRVISLSGLSMPSFWLGLLILMGFVHFFGWIPIYTRRPPACGTSCCSTAFRPPRSASAAPR